MKFSPKKRFKYDQICVFFFEGFEISLKKQQQST